MNTRGTLLPIPGAGEHLADQPIIFVMVGVPGAGKSTWAQSTFGWDVYDRHVVSTDYFVEQYAQKRSKTYTEVWTKAIKDAEKQMNARVQELIKGRKLIVWDQTNLTAKKRKKILKSLPKEYKKYAVVFNTNLDLVKKRLVSRAEQTGKSIPIDIWNDMVKTLEIPTSAVDEGFDDLIVLE